MPHMSINGITFATASDAVFDEPEFVGEIGERSVNGTFVGTEIVEKDVFRGRTVYALAATAEAWRSLINGDGHAFHFENNDAYSDKGLAPSAGTYTTPSGTAKHGTRSLLVASGQSISYALAGKMGRPGWTYADGWTFVGWKHEGSSFAHYIATGKAIAAAGVEDPAGITQYEDGVAGTYGLGYWLDVLATDTVTLKGRDGANAGTNCYFDDFAFWPFEMPAAWAPQLYTWHNANALPTQPRVIVAGDVTERSAGVECRGRVTSITQGNARIDGAHRNNARILEFALFER